MKIILPLQALASPQLTELKYTGTHGLYSAVTPTPNSAKYLMELATALGFQIEPEKLHCTVMYSKNACSPENAVCDPKKVYQATFAGLQYWAGHDNKGYVSVKMDSVQLTEEHMRFRNAGCVPTFDEYRPHVTLWAGIELTPELIERMRRAEDELLPWQTLEFSNQFVGDLKAD